MLFIVDVFNVKYQAHFSDIVVRLTNQYHMSTQAMWRTGFMKYIQKCCHTLMEFIHPTEKILCEFKIEKSPTISNRRNKPHFCNQRPNETKGRIFLSYYRYWSFGEPEDITEKKYKLWSILTCLVKLHVRRKFDTIPRPEMGENTTVVIEDLRDSFTTDLYRHPPELYIL